jgi:hypothetical protein
MAPRLKTISKFIPMQIQLYTLASKNFHRSVLTSLLLIAYNFMNAQVGISTTTPNSTLDVRGSLSVNYRSFTGNTTASSTDYALTFTGTTASSITLPDAATCTGRTYIIKNSSATLPTPVLSVLTTGGQTLDGNSSWILDMSKEMITVMSNGTGWDITSGNSNSNKDDLAIGNLYITTPVATTFAALNTPKKLSGTTTSASLYRVTAAANRLTYTGTKQKNFQVICSLTGTQTSSNIIYSVYIAVNGVVLPESQQTMKFRNNADKVSLTVSCITPLNPNDYIEVWIENETTAAIPFTAETLNLSMR